MSSPVEVSASTVLEFAQQQGVQMVDFRFSDLHGLWHHISYPIAKLTLESFRDGFGIDGSSIRGWAAIHESDMLLIPDPSTFVMDPFTEVPTLGMIADVIDPVTRQRYDRDPRYIATKAEMYLASSGIADEAMFGAEAEFFIFDNVSFEQSANHGFYYIDADEGRWNSARRENNLGYRPRYREGYFPVPPTDHHQDLRTEMLLTMQECGLDVECHHHEVASGGQGEIDLHYSFAAALRRRHDALQVHCAQRGPPARQIRNLHAQTALSGKRQQHAHPPVPVEGRQAAVLRRRLCRALRDCAVVYRRPHQARPGACGADGADHQ